jgi:CHAT domain-containing protein
MRFPGPITFIVRYLSIFILLLPAVSSSRAQVVDQQDVPLLEPSQPVKRKIGGNESHYYRIALMTDQYVQIIVDQRGADVRVKLFQPDGNVVAESNKLTGPYGPEAISWVAQSPGLYKLEVRSIERSKRTDSYEVKLSEERVATFQDRNRLTSQSVFIQAEQLLAQKTPQSLEQAIAKYEEALKVSQNVKDAQCEAETLNVLGLIYHILKQDSQNARQRFDKALQIQQASGDRRGQAETLTNIARTYESSRAYPTALEYYARALQPWQDAGDKYGQAWALDNIGRIHYLSKDAKSALDYQNRALKMWAELGDVAREAATLNAIGETYVLISDFKNARSTYEQARDRCQAAGDGDCEVSVLFSISEVYKKLSDEQHEREYNALAERLAREVAAAHTPTPEDQDRWNKMRRAEEAQAEARKLLSGTDSDQRRAVEKYEEAVRIFDSMAEYDREIFVLFDISSAYRTLKEKNKERQTLERSLSLARRVRSNSLQAETLKRLADYYLSDADLLRAAQTYDSAIELWQKKQGDRSSEAYVLAAAAKVYNDLGNKVKPRAYLERALKLYRELGDRFREAYTLDDFAKISDGTDTRQTALDYLKQTRDLRRANHDRAGEAQSLKEIIALYLSLGQKRETLSFYHQALALYRQNRDGLGEAEILRDLMRYWTEQDRRGLAIFYGKQAINAYQQIRRNIQGLDKQTQTSFINSKEEIYRQLADLLIYEGRIPEAEQVLNLLKEEEFNNFIRSNTDDDTTAAPNPNTDPKGLTETETRLYGEYKARTATAAALSAEYEQLYAKKTRTDSEEVRMDELLKQLKAADDELQNYLTNVGTEFLTPDNKNRLDNIKGLMSDRKLEPGSVVIYTLIAKNRYSVLIFTPSVKVAGQYPIDNGDLNQKVGELRKALTNPTKDPRPPANALYKVLIEPIEDQLKIGDPKTLMWSLDGVLRYVPIAALYDGKQYMVQRYDNEVFTPTSISRLGDKATGAWRGLGFGVSLPTADKPLPAVETELNNIFRNEDDVNATGGLLPGKIFLNGDFKQDTMIRVLRLRRYPVVHVASHFTLNPNEWLNSYLTMGNGSRLTAGDIKGLPGIFSGVELLTLSACNTAVDAVTTGGNGSEFDNFGELAQQQGARAVMATLWAVSDPSTAIFMKKFYEFRVQNSQEPMSKAAALKKAQLAFLDKEVTSPDRNYAHPYFWAPFILIGNWQ